jgi:hypothetical protein
MSNLSPIEPDSLSPSRLLADRYGLDRLTRDDAALHKVLQASNAQIHKLILKTLKSGVEELSLDDASKIADRLTRALKTHYELLDLKGKLHDKDDQDRKKIIARVGIRQTAHGQEAVAEVEVGAERDSA